MTLRIATFFFLFFLVLSTAQAQDSGDGSTPGTTPGLHSLEMSDQTIDTLYKLKTGTAPQNSEAPTAHDPDNDSSGAEAGAGSTDNPTPKNPAQPGQAKSPPKTDPNIQSHSLTFIPDSDEQAAPDPSDQKTKKGKTTLSKSRHVDPDEPDPDKDDDRDDADDDRADTDTPSPHKTRTLDKSDSPLDPHVFTPTLKLKPWDKQNQLYGLGRDSAKIRDVLTVFESEPEYANPQTLMEIAQLYAQVGDYKSAARYYYAANLRRAFDARRFPASDIPPLDGGGWGASVGAWVADSSARMHTVANDVRAWDARVPYRYHPGYRVPQGSLNTTIPDESEWPDLLAQTRTDFFKSLDDIAKGLASMGK